MDKTLSLSVSLLKHLPHPSEKNGHVLIVHIDPAPHKAFDAIIFVIGKGNAASVSFLAKNRTSVGNEDIAATLMRPIGMLIRKVRHEEFSTFPVSVAIPDNRDESVTKFLEIEDTRIGSDTFDGPVNKYKSLFERHCLMSKTKSDRPQRATTGI